MRYPGVISAGIRGHHLQFRSSSFAPKFGARIDGSNTGITAIPAERAPSHVGSCRPQFSCTRSRPDVGFSRSSWIRHLVGPKRCNRSCAPNEIVTKTVTFFRRSRSTLSRKEAFEGWPSASGCARISVTMKQPPAEYSLASSPMASTTPTGPGDTDLIVGDAARGDRAALRSLLERDRERRDRTRIAERLPRLDVQERYQERSAKHERIGGAAIRNGLRPLDRPFVTLLGTAPGGPWGGFDRTLARACSHTRCRCQADVRYGRRAATLPCLSPTRGGPRSDKATATLPDLPRRANRQRCPPRPPRVGRSYLGHRHAPSAA